MEKGFQKLIVLSAIKNVLHVPGSVEIDRRGQLHCVHVGKATGSMRLLYYVFSTLDWFLYPIHQIPRICLINTC